LDSAQGLEKPHANLSTELAILYSKYKPAKLGDHIKLYRKKLQVPRLCQACKDNRQWHELAFLLEIDNEVDKSLRIMMEHPCEAFDDIKFKELVVKATNAEIYYEAIRFYLDMHPESVNDLLAVLIPKVDHAKVVERVRKLQHLPIIKKYLLAVQEKNIAQVNEAINELLIEEEDYEALRHSVDSYDNFDSIGLARKLEKHEFLEFRRISAHLYKLNKRFKQSVEVSKLDKMYKDCVETASDSKDSALAEELLYFFVEKEKSPHCFSACLFTCYDLIRPDVALELAWRHKMVDFAFPYIIQFVREYTTRVNTLTSSTTSSNGTATTGSTSATPVGPPGGVPPGVGLPPGAMPPGVVVGLPPHGALPPGVFPPPGFAYPPPGTMALPMSGQHGHPGHFTN